MSEEDNRRRRWNEVALFRQHILDDKQGIEFLVVRCG